MGLEVIDVSNPTNCVCVGSFRTCGSAQGVAVADNRLYVVDGENRLVVLPSLSNVQFSVRVDATPGEISTLEAAKPPRA